MGLGFVLSFRILVHGFSGDPARDGGGFDERRAADASDRRDAEDGVSVSGDSARHDRDRLAEPAGDASERRLRACAAC